jgi:hypothetical protein
MGAHTEKTELVTRGSKKACWGRNTTLQRDQRAVESASPASDFDLLTSWLVSKRCGRIARACVALEFNEPRPAALQPVARNGWVVPQVTSFGISVRSS